ncbi:MAG: PAS domain-containing protein [Desulfovibrio sp.]|nr:PAS domain-containing protein [Desulfovibrio sp.]
MKKRFFYFAVVWSIFLAGLLWKFDIRARLSAEARYGLEHVRVTVIEEGGGIAFDSFTDARRLDNHGNRPEVIDARQKGYGESLRYSDTQEEALRYYAVTTAGGNILRLAIASWVFSGILSRLAPVLLFCVLASLAAVVCAGRLADRLAAAFGRPRPDDAGVEGYSDADDERVFFVRKIETQREEIVRRHADMEEQTRMTMAITERMREGLVLLDKDGRVRLLNAGASAIFGARGVANKDVLYLCRHMEFLGAVRACLSGGREEALVELERGGRIYAAHIHPTHAGGMVNGAVILLRDTTEGRKAEEQRRQFSANVSHELKTPLTTISALSEMIGNDLARQEDVKGFALKISGQARRLINIIDDIIRLSEFDEGKTDRSFSSFDLGALARSVLDGLREKAQARGISLELRGDGVTMTANARMIDELLYNLVDNAIKYNADGGKVEVSFGVREDTLAVAVSDTGIGIAAEHQDRVFERFYRVDHARSQRTGGTGLGLSIVKHIVEHHKGAIALDSTERGTTVTCRFRRGFISEDVRPPEALPAGG